MGGRGSGGSRNGGGSRAQITVDEDRFDSYSLSDKQKASMRAATEDVKDSINGFMKDPWVEKDTDHMYEYLADSFPRAMYGDDAEKVVRVDTKNEYITTVRVSALDNSRTGKLEVELRPASYDFGEFSNAELEDMGVERRKR